MEDHLGKKMDGLTETGSRGKVLKEEEEEEEDFQEVAAVVSEEVWEAG